MLDYKYWWNNENEDKINGFMNNGWLMKKSWIMRVDSRGIWLKEWRYVNRMYKNGLKGDGWIWCILEDVIST